MPSVVSINVGSARHVQVGSRTVRTGIDKRPVERAAIHAYGVTGDVVADEENHGGLDQAVYAYSAEDLAWWEAELGRALPPGSFGENLTLSSFGPREVRIGDRFRVGGAVLEATAPRIPCSVFAGHVDERQWVKRFAAGRRPGFYARVLEPGEVAAGDRVEALGGGEANPEVVELLDTWYDRDAPPETLRRLLAAPIAERARADLERRLEKLVA